VLAWVLSLALAFALAAGVFTAVDWLL